MSFPTASHVIFSTYYFIVCVLVFYMHLCLYITDRVSGTHGGQKRALDIPELELQTLVSQYVGAENGTWSSSRAASALNC